MDTDCYQVEVLYHLTPHLIWVEVVKNGPKTDCGQEILFEQIGIYGILPADTILDDEGQILKTRKCSEWLPSALVTLKKALSDNVELWFSPTHIDKKVSLFQNNIHKYGELTLKKSNGKIKKLSQVLVKAGFAIYDECLFYQELSLGNLKTKLSDTKTEFVFKHLEKYCKDKDNSALTVENLEKHNEKKQYVDEQSVKNLLLMKFYQMTANEGSEISANSKSQVDKPQSSLQRKLRFLKLPQNNVKNPNNLNSSTPIQLSAKVQEDKDKVDGMTAILSKDSIMADANARQATCPSVQLAEVISRRKRSDLKGKVKQVFKIKENTNVAFGPPGVNIMSLETKTVKIDSLMRNNGIENVLANCNKAEIGTTKEVDIVHNTEKEKPCEDIGVQLRKRENKYKNYKDDTNIAKSQDDNLTKDSETDQKRFRSMALQKKLSLHKPNNDNSEESPKKSKFLQAKLKIYKEQKAKSNDLSVSDTSAKDSSTSLDDQEPKANYTTNTDLESDDASIGEVIKKLEIEYHDSAKVNRPKVSTKSTVMDTRTSTINHVNPFKNIDSNISVFVDKLVNPVLMVHSKVDHRIVPQYNVSDVSFTSHIRVALKNMGVTTPMAMQMVSWWSILRGYSVFMVGPMKCGKTLGYIPAVCRLISDDDMEIVDSVGPRCIIICATSESVTSVERLCKKCLTNKKVYSCYAGIDELEMTTSLLNGCDLFICTPSVMTRLLTQTEFGLDLRRLMHFVVDDFEMISEVYINELKLSLFKVKEMQKSRPNKQLKVQYIVASRIWCDDLGSIVRKAPYSLICIGALHECVLYSKANTTVNFVLSETKFNCVLDFLNNIDQSKKTVMVCRTDQEVEYLRNKLSKLKYTVFSSDTGMSVEDLYIINKRWMEYEEPVSGPILVCLDINLAHLNVTDAHYLVHYSLPASFSSFRKRFAVLNENYSSIFKDNKNDVKIKILVEEKNSEQLPKILHFIKRCTGETPEFLNEVCANILAKKDEEKAKQYVPVCDNLLALGKCPDYWNCRERHAFIADFDQPKEWIPKGGLVSFKILHFHTAALYSARLFSVAVNGVTNKFAQTYNTLPLKMDMFFSKENNRQLHGIPKLGDICAMSRKHNFLRCQVVKILSYYHNGNPNDVLVRLIDEEKLERTRDIYLYYLPNELRSIQTYVVQVRLANIQPRDKDITFSELAKIHLHRIVEQDEEYFMRGHVALTVGNCIFVDNLEVCQELTSLNKVVVRCNIVQALEAHGLPNPKHMLNITKLAENGGLVLKKEEVQPVKTEKIKVVLPEERWAHLENGDVSCVFFASVENPNKFFVRLDKFDKCFNMLLSDIKKHIETDKPQPIENVTKGDIVLAMFPDDSTYERARIDELIDENKVKCFFVDQGDWREISKDYLLPITDKFISQMPFQAIECRLIGVRPFGDYWTEFATNWFCDSCFEDEHGKSKHLYVAHFTKEKAECTGGHKYGVVVIDTNSEQDVIINELMIEANLAEANEQEMKYIDQLDFKKKSEPLSNLEDVEDWEEENQVVPFKTEEKDEADSLPRNHLLFKKPIRSVPLVGSDDEFEDPDKWDINMTDDFFKMFRPKQNKTQQSNVPAIKEISTKSHSQTSDYEIVTSPRISSKELDSDDLTSPDVTLTDELLRKEEYTLRKPKVTWRQNKTFVTLKILLIGVETYDLVIKDRHLNFSAKCNDTEYGFEFELYGIVNHKNSSHCNKGQYILVKLPKVMTKNWLTLTRDGSLKKWIVYDVDSIDAPSSEEQVDDSFVKIAKDIHDKESESEDESFCDDINFKYKNDSD